MADQKKPEKEPRPVTKTGDPIISQIGDFRIYQILFCGLVFLSKFGTGWHTLAHIFLAGPTPHKCIDPPNLNDTKQCEGCKAWEYNTSIFKKTIVTEWDLVCGHAFLSSFSQSIVMAGIMFGSIVFGMIADRCGRRPAFLGCCMMQLITGLIVCLSPYYWFYCIFRFLVAFATGGTMCTSFVLIMEIIGPKKREAVAICYQLPFNVGHASLALFAYFIRTWRWFQFSITIFSAVFIVYFCLIPESPRWLLTTGQLDKSIQILEKIAKFNNAPVDSVRGEIETAAKAAAAKAKSKKGNITDLFRTPFLRLKTIAMAFDWLVVCMVYYGVGQFIGKMAGNIFINVGITALLGVPGTLSCVVLTKFFGRKFTLILSNAISCVALFLLTIIYFFPSLPVLVGNIMAGLGLFGASITFPNVYLYGGELFPTVVRSNGMGLCSMVGRIGSIVAPPICDLARFGLWITPLIFGIFSLLAALGTCLLPETKGQPLPETLEDGENFGRHHKD